MAIPSNLQNQNYIFSDLVTRVSRLEAPPQDTDQGPVKKKRTVKSLDKIHIPRLWWQKFKVRANDNMRYYGLPRQNRDRYDEDIQSDREDEYLIDTCHKNKLIW